MARKYYYHVSRRKMAIGQTILPSGKVSLGPNIENALEQRRPPEMLARNQAVFLAPHTEFNLYGMGPTATNVYQVTVDSHPEPHDVHWIGQLQRAQNKRGMTFPPADWMDWNDKTLRYLCANYWFAEPSMQPVWEYLAPQATIVKVLKLTESHDPWRLVAIDSLPRETQADICGWIAEHTPLFEDDPSYVRDNLFGLARPPQVWRGMMRVAQLLPTMRRSNASVAVRNYAAMLKTPVFEFDPILVADGRFLDGGHRLQAYAEAGRAMIPVVEIGHLVNAPVELWQRWVDGDETAQFIPVKRTPSS